MNNQHTPTPLITRDWLAIERTKLANERTFLAYLRTSILFLGSGISVFKIDVLSNLQNFGIFLLVLSPLVFLVGLWRFLSVKKKIEKYYTPPS